MIYVLEHLECDPKQWKKPSKRDKKEDNRKLYYLPVTKLLTGFMLESITPCLK